MDIRVTFEFVDPETIFLRNIDHHDRAVLHYQSEVIRQRAVESRGNTVSGRIASIAPHRTECDDLHHPADDHKVIPGDEWHDKEWHREQGDSSVSVNGDGWPATKCGE